MWLLHSISYFRLCVYGTSLASRIMCANICFLFWKVWKGITNVLSALTTGLFSLNHVCSSFTTLFILYWSLCVFSSDTNMFVSFANNIIFDPVVFRGRSFWYSKNSTAPRIEPRGTACSVSIVVFEMYVPALQMDGTSLDAVRHIADSLTHSTTLWVSATTCLHCATAVNWCATRHSSPVTCTNGVAAFLSPCQKIRIVCLLWLRLVI